MQLVLLCRVEVKTVVVVAAGPDLPGGVEVLRNILATHVGVLLLEPQHQTLAPVQVVLGLPPAVEPCTRPRARRAGGVDYEDVASAC